MTPGARLAAAISVLDRHLAGEAAERALTNWARRNRFAGSKDRAAIRDLVFDVLRRKRSSAALGGGGDGRALVLGLLIGTGEDPRPLFDGQGYAPPPLGPDELARLPGPQGLPAIAERGAALDCQDWLLPLFDRALADRSEAVLRIMRERAPVFLRANLLRGGRAEAIAALGAEGIAAEAHPLSPTAIRLCGHPRGLQAGAAFRTGLVELQDAASQAVVDMLPLRPGGRTLDYCAGGGGKTLAIAARLAGDPAARVAAFDIDPARMRDLPSRAQRTGARVDILTPGALARGQGHDLVFCDAPCSGSGAWRRSPQAKWQLTPEELQHLCAQQAEVLARASRLVAPGGVLAYATCSLFDEENSGQLRNFLASNPGWSLKDERLFTPCEGGDGFYCAVLTQGQG